jgi:hypothetical protein
MVMALRTLLIASLLTTLATAAFAQSGTPEEQAACRADVRRFCAKTSGAEGSNAFLQCLQANKARLSKRCLAVLEKHGA